MRTRCLECAGGRYRPRPGEQFVLCSRHAAEKLYVIAGADDVQKPVFVTPDKHDTFSELVADAEQLRPPAPLAGVFVRGLPERRQRGQAGALAWARPGAEDPS